MSKPIEISFAPKKKETYIVNSGTKYGHFSKQELKSQMGELEKEENNEPLYTAPLLLKLFMLTSSLNINPLHTKPPKNSTFDYDEYVKNLPSNYLDKMIPTDKKYITQSKSPLVYYKGEEKKVRFF
jgi:hypothetical protein